ncbi:MAG TPA: E3 ubiquitin ligase family protein [Thermomicrobiaceae bacterium]|nr:E3 ubiquitin ligase family protein [Thermomicrobiaceae bacterium]
MSTAITLLILGILGLGAGALQLYLGRTLQRKTDLLARVPASSAADVSRLLPGEPVAVQGTLRCDAPLTGEISQQPCAYYEATVVRQYERDRRRRRRRSRDTRSEVVSTNRQAAPFSVEDASGRVLVRPDEAEIDARSVVNRFEQAANRQPVLSYGGLSLELSRGDGTVGYRYEERALPLGIPVFVLGAVQESGEIGPPPVGSHSGAFIVSARGRDTLRREWGSRARWLAVAAIVLFALGVALTVAGLVTLVVK